MTDHQQQGPSGEAHLGQAAHGKIGDLPHGDGMKPIVAGQHVGSQRFSADHVLTPGHSAQPDASDACTREPPICAAGCPLAFVI
jgi:hypothetical protein